MSVSNTLRNARRNLFDNAAAVRDYRVQMRGSRSAILFGVYLFVLIASAMTVYQNLSANGTVTAIEAQSRLQDFYRIVVGILGGVVSLVAPALTATAIVIERQRRSLDLVFSAPVEPRYYLIGKLISSYRYTWMLLVLALPITAACVVLGGSSWSDVLVTYFALSMHGLVFTSIALFISTVAPKPVSAVTWSYGAAILYLIATTSAAGASYAMSYSTRSLEAPFFSAMNPFMLGLTIDTFTRIGTWEVPNWVFTMLLSLLIARICLLGASIYLNPRPERDIRAVRFHYVLWTTALASYFGYTFASSSQLASAQAFGVLFPIFMAMPMIATYGTDAERRFRPNGLFNFRHLWDGTAAGSLPFVLLFCTTTLVGAHTGAYFGKGVTPDQEGLLLALFTVAFWFFFWSIGRLASSPLFSLRSARLTQFVAFVVLAMAPVPAITALEFSMYGSTNSGLWNAYMLSPVFRDDSANVLRSAIWGGLLLAGGFVFTAIAERKLSQRLTPEQLNHERILATT
jgi:ABC-type transport system involved in multi-copper enzyme maturation permease subunit